MCIRDSVPAVLLDGGLFFWRQALLELLDEPVQRDVLARRQRGLDALVVGAEGLVVAVVERFVLDQRGARQEVEVVQRGRCLLYTSRCV